MVSDDYEQQLKVLIRYKTLSIQGKYTTFNYSECISGEKYKLLEEAKVKVGHC